MKLTVEISTPRWLSSRWARRSTPLLLLLTLAIGVPVVLASDRFIDVPTTHSHHDDINKLASAGVTVGCAVDDVSGNPLFCPDQSVTRGQMASFLVRGLGRTTHAWLQQATPSGAFGEAGWDIFITPGVPPGALSGATGYINAQATVVISSSDSNPCKANLALWNETDQEWMNAVDTEVNPIAASGGRETLVVIGQSQVASPGERNLAVLVSVTDVVDSSACTATVQGDATATYFPFSE